MIIKVTFLLLQITILLYLFYRENKTARYQSILLGINVFNISILLIMVNTFTFLQVFLLGAVGYNKIITIAQSTYLFALVYIFYLFIKKQNVSLKNIFLGEDITSLKIFWFLKLVLLLIIFVYMIPALIVKGFGPEYYINKVITSSGFNPIKYIHINYPMYVFPALLFVVIFAPLVEELLYRKIIYTYLKKILNIKVAFILALFLFYLAHYSFPNIHVVLFGCLYLWIFEKTSSVLFCIIAHSIRNSQVLVDYFIWTKKYDIENILFFIGVFSVLILIFVTIKQKHFLRSNDL